MQRREVSFSCGPAAVGALACLRLAVHLPAPILCAVLDKNLLPLQHGPCCPHHGLTATSNGVDDESGVGPLARAAWVVHPAALTTVSAGRVDGFTLGQLEEVRAAVRVAAQQHAVACVRDVEVDRQSAARMQAQARLDQLGLHHAQPVLAQQMIPAVLSPASALLAWLPAPAVGRTALRRHHDGTVLVRGGAVGGRPARLLRGCPVAGTLSLTLCSRQIRPAHAGGCPRRCEGGDCECSGGEGGADLRRRGRRLQVRPARQRIRDHILHTRDVLDGVVEFRHVLNPASQTWREVRHGLVVLQRVVVGQQLERLRAAHILPPVLAGVVQRQELALAHIVVHLSGSELA